MLDTLLRFVENKKNCETTIFNTLEITGVLFRQALSEILQRSGGVSHEKINMLNHLLRPLNYRFKGYNNRQDKYYLERIYD